MGFKASLMKEHKVKAKLLCIINKWNYAVVFWLDM